MNLKKLVSNEIDFHEELTKLVQLGLASKAHCEELSHKLRAHAVCRFADMEAIFQRAETSPSPASPPQPVANIPQSMMHVKSLTEESEKAAASPQENYVQKQTAYFPPAQQQSAEKSETDFNYHQISEIPINRSYNDSPLLLRIVENSSSQIKAKKIEDIKLDFSTDQIDYNFKIESDNSRNVSPVKIPTQPNLGSAHHIRSPAPELLYGGKNQPEQNNLVVKSKFQPKDLDEKENRSGNFEYAMDEPGKSPKPEQL